MQVIHPEIQNLTHDESEIDSKALFAG